MYSERPFICTGFYGAYDYGDPIYFKGIDTLLELQQKYPRLTKGCDICDDCLHEFVRKDELEIRWDCGEMISLKSLQNTETYEEGESDTEDPE